MDYNQALTELIAHVDPSGKPVSLAWDELQLWGEGVLEGFVAVGLLTKDVNASSLQCSGCEYHCFMDVLLANDESERAFIVCDHAEMQAQMGRINVPPERLQQWQTSAKHLAIIVSDILVFEMKPDYKNESASFKLGMLKGKNGRRWVRLQTKPLSLEINRHTVPLTDLLYFEAGNLLIDEMRINALVNATPKETGKVNSSNIKKQELRKLATQAMYQDWNDEYQRLKKKQPGKSDLWCSMQIAKLAIAQGKDSETIRKNMKKV
jgi:hypothetical protein